LVHVGKQRHPGHVADRPHAVGYPAILVHRHTLLVRGDPDDVQPEVVHRGERPAGPKDRNPRVSVAELVAAGGTTTSPISRLHVADQG
jgi:hypothetical protein